MKINQNDIFDDKSTIIKQMEQHGWNLTDDNFKLSTAFQPAQIELCKQHLGLIYLPEYIGEKEPLLQRTPTNFTPTLHLPVWLVCHQELRTNLRIRRVFDFIATELQQQLTQNLSRTLVAHFDDCVGQLYSRVWWVYAYEDVGGILGYTDFLEKWFDYTDPEHDEVKEWVGDHFDRESFDPIEINKILGEQV